MNTISKIFIVLYLKQADEWQVGGRRESTKKNIKVTQKVRKTKKCVQDKKAIR